MADDRDVAAVNLSERIAVSGDDAIGDITHLYDGDGRETRDHQEALAAVISWRDRLEWSAVDLTAFDFTKRSH